MKKALIFSLVVVGLLAVTNPGMSDFQDYVQTRATDRIAGEIDNEPVADLLGGAGGELLANSASRVTERRSYLVCSLYVLDVDQDDRPNGRALGVAGQFFVLDEFTADD